MISTSHEIARRRVMIPFAGGEMALLRFGAPGAPPLLFAHANGFCASAYRQMFEALGERYDIFGVDLRGFGATRLPTDPVRHRSMEAFAADLRALLPMLAARFELSGRWTISGHSLGGSSATLAAAGREDVAAIRLVEPVAFPRAMSLLARTPVWPWFADRMPLVRGARSRRAEWPDRASVRASYAKKALFSTWAPGVLDDYLVDGLRDEADGVALACAPQWEAAAFRGHAHDFWGAVSRAPAPVRVLRAAHASSTVPAPAVGSFKRRNVAVETIEGFTHLVPFEAPQLVADFIAAP